MARKKDSRSRRNQLRKQRLRKNRRHAGLGSSFRGHAEPLEKRELLAGDLVSSLVDSSSSSDETFDLASAGQVASLPAAPPPVYTALVAELSSTQTKSLASTIKSLDVSGIDKDLIVTVTKGNGNNNTISVQEMSSNGAGTGGIVTYAIEKDGGSIANLVAGHQNRDVKINLNGKLDLLELTQADDFQFAIGHKATSSSLLTKSTWVQVVKQSKGEIDTLEVGQSGKTNDVGLILGRDIQIGKLAKGTNFGGKLSLHYPDKNTSSRPAKMVDLSLTKPQVRGFSSLDGFTAASFSSVSTGDGRHELKAGDQIIQMAAGGADDVLIGGENAQVFDGDAGKDYLDAGPGDDTLRGGAGVDQLIGGPGNDALEGGADDDVYRFGEEGKTDQNQWGTDVITETDGENVLDFEHIHAQLNVDLNGDAISVTSTKQIDGDAATGLSFGSDEDAVVLSLGASSIPTATVTGDAISAVSTTNLIARMIVGSARNQITVDSPTPASIDTQIDLLAQADPVIQTNVEYLASRLTMDAGELAIAIKDDAGEWTFASPGTKVVLSELLPTPSQVDDSKSLDDETNVWSIMPKALTFAVGDFKDGETAAFEAAQFEVTFFGESTWTGYTGSQTDLEGELDTYYFGTQSQIDMAATRADILRSADRVNQITEEVWLESIQSAIETTYSLTSGSVSAEVLNRGTSKVLSVSLGGHTGDVAIAPNTVSLPANLSTTMPTQSVSGTAHISKFIAPKNDNAQVTYKITSLTRDFEIAYGGTEAKSTLDLSALTGDLRIEFSGPGEVSIEVGSGASAQKLTAAGISEVLVGNGNKTFVLSQAAGERQMTVSETSGATGERHLVLGAGFAGATVVVNNDTNAWTLDGGTFAPSSMEFQGVRFTAPNIGDISFKSVSAEPGFLGNLKVNGAETVATGRGDDVVRQTAATPADITITTGAGNDEFVGDDLADKADGGDGDDVLRGNEGDDTLTGGKGNDELIGGPGNDSLTGGPDDDTYTFSATWGVDSIVEEKGEGESDVIDLSAVEAAMVHVISGNEYHGFTGADNIQASQSLLTGSARSAGKIQVKSGETWSDFDATSTSHVDAAANRVSVADEKFQFIEGIKTSTGNNTFYFGNDWGPDAFWATAGSSILPGVSALNPDRTLEVDTSNANELVLDFRQVTDELKFTFEREDDGSISLTVVKTDGLTIPFLDAEILEDGDVEVNEIKFTKVDENTTIYGGREANTFSLDGDATFAGTLVGGEGFRDWVGAPDTEGLTTGEKALEWAKFIFDKMQTLHSLLGGDLPDIFVSNKIDYTDASPFVASGDTAWEVAKSGIKSLFHSVRLREVGSSDLASSIHQHGWHAQDHGTQSLVLASNVQSFKLKVGGTETTLLTSSTSTADFNTALAALDFELDSTSPGAGTSASPYLLKYTGTGTAEPLQVLAYTDVAGTDANQVDAFGAIWSKAAARPEIQTLWLDDVANADSLEISVGTASVTWAKDAGEFKLADFHTANATTTSPVLPISTVAQVEGSGTESDPWKFSFDADRGDLPQMSVTVTSSGSDTATATIQTQQDGENSLAEVQSFVSPGYTYRLKLDGQSTIAIPSDATPEQIADAINELSSLTSAEAGRVSVDGAGTDVSPYRISFAEPGDRSLMTIEPAWLDVVEAGTPKKFILNVDAAKSGRFKLKYNTTESANLGYRPTAAEVASALATITGVTAAKISVIAVETTTPVAKAGSRFEIEIDDASLNAAGLDVVPGTLVFDTASVGQVRAGTSYDSSATVTPPSSIQHVRSSLASGEFTLRVGNRTSSPISALATKSVFETALAGLLGHSKFSVTEPVLLSGIRTWTITFDSDLGDVLAVEAIDAAGGSQRAHGFATLRNIDSVDYGAGLNYLEGQNIDLSAAAGSFEKLMEGKDFFAFIEQFFGGGLQAGDDTFAVGGNVLTMARDYLVEQASLKAGRSESVLDTLEEKYPFANTLLETALGPWFGGTVAPGAHVLAGLSGADTYQFEGIYGAAAILEAPDIEVAGFAVPEGYDTLDLSGTDYDLTIDVYQASLSDIPGIGTVLEAIPGLMGHENMPLMDVTSNIMIVRDGAISEKLGDFTLGAVDSSDIFGGEAGNVILAFDIENLVLGEGKTTIKMHGDASIQGTIATHDDGKLFLDYSEYDELLDVDAEGGVQWEIIPELEIVPEFQIGDLTVEAVKYPGIQIEFGRASGVEGNRLMGLTQMIQVLDDWGIDTTSLTGFRPVDNAVTAIDRVTLPAGNAIVDADEGHLDTDGIAWHAQPGGTATVTDTDSITKQVSTTASTGYVGLSYGTVAALPVAVDATAAQLQAALNAVTGATTVAVTGEGTASSPWVVKKNAAQLTLDNVGSTNATITSTETTSNSTYTLAYTGGGNIDIAFGSESQTVNINSDSAIEAAIEALTGWDATVTSGTNEYTIALALKPIATAVSGYGSGVITEVSGLQDTLAVDASVGVFRIQYGDATSQPISYNATPAQVAAAINSVTGANSVQVTGAGTSASPWDITRVADEVTLSDAASTGATLSSNAGNSTYTLSYSTAGDIEVTFQSNTKTLAVSDKQAVKDAFESLTGMTATLSTNTPNTWTVTLSLEPIAIAATGTSSVAMEFVDASSEKKLALDANAGIFALTYGATSTTPIAFSATSEQVQDAINRVTGVQTVDVSGAGTASSPWIITQASTAVTVSSDDGSTGATLTSSNAGNTAYSLSYTTGGNITLAFDGKTQASVNVANASSIETALESLTGMDATVTSSGSKSFTISLALNAISTQLTNVELVTGITSGLLNITKPSENANTGIANVQEIDLGSDDKLLFGSSGEEEDDKFTIILEDSIGKSLVVGTPDEPIQVLIGESLRDEDGDATINEKHFGGVSVYYTDTSHYLIAVQTEQIQPEKDKLKSKLASNWAPSAIEVGIDAVKSELGNLMVPTQGTGTTSLSSSDASTRLTEAISLWNAVNGISVTTTPALVIEDLPGNQLAFFDANTTTIHLDATAVGHEWHTGDKDSTVAATEIDLLTVLVHEIGHGLGLDHSDAGTMHDVLEPGERHIDNLAVIVSSQQQSESNKLLNGLTAMANWSNNLDQRLIDEMLSIDLPFGKLSLADVVPDNVLPDTNALKSKVTTLQSSVSSYLSSAAAPTVDGLLTHLNTDLTGFTVVRTGSELQQYSVLIDVAQFNESLSFDLGNWNFDDLGLGDLPFDLKLKIASSYALPVEGKIQFAFDFGLDQNGHFFVADPTVSANLSVGDDAYEVAIDDDNGDKSLAADSTSGQVYLEGDATGSIKSGDTVVVTDSNGEITSYLVGGTAGDALTYDNATGRTSLVLLDSEGNPGGFDDGDFKMSVRKSFDVDVNLGIFGLKLNDGFIDFDAGFEIGLDGEFSTASLLGNAGTGSIDVSLGGGGDYAIYLPLELAGALDGLNDNQAIISAFSADIYEDASLKELIFSIPQSLQLSGFSELLQMRGISLEMILDALEAGLDDLVGVDRAIYGVVDSDTSEFSAYEPQWMETSTVLTTYTAVTTAGIPETRRVTLEGSRDQLLLKFNDGSNDIWGVEFEETVNDVTVKKVKVFEERYKLLATFPVDDYTTLTSPAADITATLADGTTATLTQLRLQTGSLYDDVPIVGVSPAEILGDESVSVAGKMRSAIQYVRENASNLGELSDQLNAKLREEFPILPDDAQLIKMRYANSQFEFDFDITLLETANYALDLDLEDLGIDDWLGFNLSELTNVDIQAQLGVTATANVGLGFGFDLQNVFEPIFYVDPTSGMSAEVVGTAEDLNFNLGFDIGSGPLGKTLGLIAENGSAEINAGLFANLGNPAADANGNGYLDFHELSNSFQAGAYGNAMLDVPLYFPIKALPLGGSELDLDANGIPDNVLHADIGFTVDENFDLQTHYETQLPEFEMTFDAAAALVGLLNDPEVVLGGLESFFDGIDKTADGIDNIELPLIGGEMFDGLAADLRSLRTGVLGAQEDSTQSGYDFSYQGTIDADDPSLGFWLEDLDRQDIGVFDAVLDRIREEIYEGLKPLNEGEHADKFGFVVPIYDEFGAEQYDDNGKLLTKFPESKDDIELELSPRGLVTFNIKFGGVLVGEKQEDGTVTPHGIPIDFGVGIPGMNLDVDAELQTEIDYLMGVGLGIGNMSDTGIDVGVFLDTSGINAVGEEIALDVDATLAPGSTAEGTLGILKMALTDVHATGSGLHGHLGLDLQDANNDGRLRIGEGLDLSLNASLSADAEIYAEVDSELAEFLPKIHTTIHYDQVLGDVELSTDGGFQMDIGTPQVLLEAVTLDVSSVFNSFLGDTFDTIKEILLPMKPVVDLLLMELDLGVIELKFIDMAYLRLPASVVDNAKKVLEVIQSTLDFIEQIDSLSNGVINFGNFNLTEQTLESDEPASNSDAQDAQGGGGSHASLLKGPDQKGHKAGKKKRTGPAYRIPFLEEPVQLLNFLLGKGDIDLFWYDLPDLELEFIYRKSFPIFTGLNGVLYGGVGAYTNFDFGFDTRGIRQWMDTGFDPAESWRIFNGFYLDDHGVENTGVDLDEVVLQATVAAGLSLGIGGLVEAGVVGGIEATIGFDLNDKETDFSSDDLPIGDGKLYGSELLDRILQGPQCLFDVSGELRCSSKRSYGWV